MAKLTTTDILKTGETLESIRKRWNKKDVDTMIAEVKEKQEAILKLKEITPEGLALRMTI